jgi:small-conductance mechanosensitive channel
VISETVIRQWLIAGGVAAGIWIVGWLVIHFGVIPLRKVFRRTKSQMDDLIIGIVRRHAPIWFLALGIDVGSRWAPLAPTQYLWLDRAIGAVFILSISVGLSSFLTGLLSRRTAPGLEIIPVNSLIQNLIRIIVLGLGLLVILGQMGVAIAPLLTALGVGSLAVALALQPTLTNLFAGLNILLAHQVRVGDFVEMEAGQTGVVTDIGWRSTTVEELAGNTFVIPNARFSEMVVKNYNLPSAENALPVEIRLAPTADLDRAEAVTREVARDVQRTAAGAIHDYEPRLVYKSLSETGVVLAVILRVRDYRDRGAVASELIKKLYGRYGESGIELSVAPRHVAAPSSAPAPPATTKLTGV